MTQNSTIQWQTGTPKETGKYLITTKHHEVEADIYLRKANEYGNH